jgi:hypothetical protein
MTKKHTPGPYHLSPDTCRYGVADSHKKMICIQHGFSTEFNALAITDTTDSKTLAIIPLDDSSVENAILFSAAADLLEACMTAQQDCGCSLIKPCDKCKILLKAIHKAQGL